MTVFNKYAGKTVYMILPDRFAIGGGKTSEQKLSEPAYDEWGVRRKSWDEKPDNPTLGNDYFGGDLQGVTDRLDYLQDLGIDLILLGPIFRAPSNHKYDTVDFFKIDPMFGDMASLKRLIAEAKKRGIDIVLDAVINHVGDNHPWFRSALNGVAKHRDYFFFKDDVNYASWWDFRHLPELDIEHADLRDYFYRKPDSVLKYYLDLGIAGWRFDAAPDLGLPYIQDVRKNLSHDYPDALLIGELTCFASEWVKNDAGFHGAMNYFMRDAVMHWLAGAVDGRQLCKMIQRYCDEFDAESACLSWNILSSHDQPRLRTQIPDLDQRVLALALQFTLPGTPAVYYGDEIGLSGGADPDCRGTMVWDTERWDKQEHRIYKHLITLRKNRRELREGRLLMLGDQIDDAEFVAYIRYTEVPEEYTIVMINSSEAPLQRMVFLPYSHIYDGVVLVDNINPRQTYRVATGTIAVVLPPRSVLILNPQLDQFNTFRFYKPRAIAREKANT